MNSGSFLIAIEEFVSDSESGDEERKDIQIAIRRNKRESKSDLDDHQSVDGSVKHMTSIDKKADSWFIVNIQDGFGQSQVPIFYSERERSRTRSTKFQCKHKRIQRTLNFKTSELCFLRIALSEIDGSWRKRKHIPLPNPSRFRDSTASSRRLLKMSAIIVMHSEDVAMRQALSFLLRKFVYVSKDNVWIDGCVVDDWRSQCWRERQICAMTMAMTSKKLKQVRF